MGKWEMVKLGDVVTLINGRAYKQEELLKHGKTPVLRVGNFFSNRSWYYSDLELQENKYCNNGDLLYAWSASFGPKIWDGPRVIFHYHIWKIVLGDSVEKGYMFYLLQSCTKRIKDQGRGIAMIHATKSGMEQMLIPIPPLETQKKIAKTLDTASELLAMRKQQLAELDNLIKSTFYDMFGDPVTNEKGWRIEKLGNICDVRDGTHDSPQYVECGYPLITSKNVVNGEISFSNVSYITTEDFDQINKRSKVDKGDIIMPMIGTIGNPAIVKTDIKFAIKNVALIKFTFSEVSNTYLKELLSSNYFEVATHKKNRGGTQKFISLSDIRNLGIPLPPFVIQAQFTSIVSIIEKKKALVQKAIDETQYLFDGLITEYLE